MKRKNRAKVIFAATISAAMVLSTFAIPVSALSETGQEIAVSAEWDDAAEMSPIGDAAEEAPDAAAELEELPDIAIAPDHYIHLDETNDEVHKLTVFLCCFLKRHKTRILLYAPCCP